MNTLAYTEVATYVHIWLASHLTNMPPCFIWNQLAKQQRAPGFLLSIFIQHQTGSKLHTKTIMGQSYSVSIEGLNHVAPKWNNRSYKVGHLVFLLGRRCTIMAYQIPCRANTIILTCYCYPIGSYIIKTVSKGNVSCCFARSIIRTKFSNLYYIGIVTLHGRIMHLSTVVVHLTMILLQTN